MGGSQGLELLTVKIGVWEAEESKVSRDFICPVCMAWGSGRLPSVCPTALSPPGLLCWSRLCTQLTSSVAPAQTAGLCLYRRLAIALARPRIRAEMLCVFTSAHPAPYTGAGGHPVDPQSLLSDPFLKTRRL